VTTKNNKNYEKETYKKYYYHGGSNLVIGSVNKQGVEARVAKLHLESEVDE
jgi:hypothetical protein